MAHYVLLNGWMMENHTHSSVTSGYFRNYLQRDVVIWEDLVKINFDHTFEEHQAESK